jgi:hypothetical protein
MIRKRYIPSEYAQTENAAHKGANIQLVQGAPSLGAKRQGREADHSPSITAEVKITWIYTYAPTYVFIS